jgi:hypothetical protein
VKKLAALLALTGALFLAGCHFAEAVEWLGKSPRPGAPTPGETATGAIPGALAGNPVAWIQLGSVLAGFLGVAVAGKKVHKHIKNRRKKKAATPAAPAAPQEK